MEGLSVYNDDMWLQIDSNYIDVSLATKTTVGEGLPSYVQNNNITAFSINDGKSVFPLNYAGDGVIYDFNSQPLIASNTGLGLELYGGNGEVYYTSKNKSIRVIDIIKFTKEQMGIDFQWSKNYGVSVAILPSNIPVHLSISSATQIVSFRSMMFYRNGQTISAAWVQYNQRPYQNSDEDLYRQSSSELEFLVIDVTGF